MCLIAFAWQVAGRPLVLLGNRDEFHPRPTRAATFWTDEGHPMLLAGKDLQAGGTWLGVTRSGRFAALTNIRSPGAQPGPRSRGKLVLDYLIGEMTPASYMRSLTDDLDDYAGFNLLIGTADQLWHLNSQDGQAQALQPGIYGLSNASLNSPWPKLKTLCHNLEANLTGDAETLLNLLKNSDEYPDAQLPDSGISLEWERRLSATFILGEEYGTRASTLLTIDADHFITFVEQTFGPNGQKLGESSWTL